MPTPRLRLAVAVSLLALVPCAAAELMLNNCDDTAQWSVANGATVTATTRPGGGAAISISHPQGGNSSVWHRNTYDDPFYPPASTETYDALRFGVKGDGATNWGDIELLYGVGWSRVWAQFPVTTTWTEVTIPWREFYQQVFTGPLADHYKEVFAIYFTCVTNKFPGDPVQAVPAQAYEVDDIRFVSGVTLDPTPTPSGISIANTVAKLQAQQPVKIVVMGASITWGLKTAAPGTDSWPYKLQELLKTYYGYSSISVLNHAIPAYNSFEGGSSLGWFAFDQEPIDLLIACDYCYNNFPDAGTPGIPEISRNYEQFFGVCLRRAHFELMHVNSGLHCEADNLDYMDGCNDALKTLCANMNIHTADMYGEFKALGQPWLTANYYTFTDDYAHCNAAGHTRVAEIVRDAIIAAGVNHAPTMTTPASASPASPAQGQSASFSVSAGDADHDALTYSWDFGDGQTASGANVSHAYSATGNYTATATATATATVKNSPLAFTIDVTFRGRVYTATVSAAYSAKQDAAGKWILK